MRPELARALKGAGSLLLDFDGPVCSIFANYTAAAVSSELRGVLAEFDAALPDSVIEESDPLEILRWTASLARPALTHAVEDALRAAEVRAVDTAAPTPGAQELLSAAREKGWSVAIVSNNSAPAIAAYADAHGLTEYIALIVGREPYRPDQMKPSPEPVVNAVSALGVQSETCVLIGDSLSDITAAHAAGVPVVAYANKPSKEEQFAEAGADAVVTSMVDIVAGLTGQWPCFK